MVSIGGFVLLMIVGLVAMGAIAMFVSAARKYLEPEQPENFYAYVGGIIIVGGIALLVLAPPIDTAVGLYANFGGWFGIMLAIVYEALAVYIAQSDDDGQQPRRSEPDRDRPLLER